MTVPIVCHYIEGNELGEEECVVVIGPAGQEGEHHSNPWSPKLQRESHDFRERIILGKTKLHSPIIHTEKRNL